MDFAFLTLGCKVNQYETQAMQHSVSAAGHNVVSPDAQPDVLVINSCTVTAESDRKTRQLLHRWRRALPHAVIVLTGCLPQAFPDSTAALDTADVLMGNASNERLLQNVEGCLRTGERVIDIERHSKQERFSTPAIDRFPERTRAYIKIQDGCERCCTYCIIPTARGFVRSKPPNEISDEVRALAANGHREIVLVGINLSTYGKDLSLNLCDAVDAACAEDGIERVRLGSLEPDLFTDEMLARLAAQPKFCPQFHLALQSGCDATLKRMNRHYDTAFFLDLVERIRAEFKNSSITTDVMVGFPGEDENEFGQSVAFVKKVGFARCHVFAYSRREGTFAAKMPGQVTRAVKAERSSKMIAAAAECEHDFLSSQVGQTAFVLFETNENGVNRGYTPNYTLVCAAGGDMHGAIAQVKLTQALDDRMIGEIIE